MNTVNNRITMNTRVFAAYTREERTALRRAAREVLGMEADTTYEEMLSAEDVVRLHPTDTYRGGYAYRGGFSSLVDLPVCWANEHPPFDEIEATPGVVREALAALPIGATVEFGEVFSEEVHHTATKLAENLYRVETFSSLSQRWERERAERLLPFEGCREAIWRAAGFPGPIDHAALDWAIECVG